jgi:hypothetical protein
MQAILPPSTNHAYQGSALAAWYLTFAGITTVIPGAIHYFLPDGGAGTIAGMDLSARADMIFAMFAWMGAVQIPQGLAEILVSLRYRPLVPIFIALKILERGLMAIDGWLGKGSISGHHPPEHYASVLSVILSVIFLYLSMREKPGASITQATE